MTKWQYWLGWTLGGLAFLVALWWVIRSAVLSALTQHDMGRYFR